MEYQDNFKDKIFKEIKQNGNIIHDIIQKFLEIFKKNYENLYSGIEKNLNYEIENL